MEELKRFELNNKVLDDFDTLMSYHLDQVEELIINENIINPKLYNIISLCINVKTLIVEGDLRVDINKIVHNLCKPELLENLVLDSVKLPTNKIIQRFISLNTISLTNVKFSDVNSFFSQIGNKDTVIALKLEKVDLIKNSISICNIFKNLQFLNINNLINCKYDDFSFLIENKKLERINIQNIKINFEHVNTLTKLNCEKTVKVNLETKKSSGIINSFEIDEDGISYLTINSTDFEKAKDSINFYKIDNLYIIQNEIIELMKFVKCLKKVKNKVNVAITDILYLDTDTAKRLKDKVGVEYISILGSNFKVKSTYTIDKFLELRESFDKIGKQVSEDDIEVDKFFIIYEYFKRNYKLVKPTNLDALEEALLEKRCEYNLFAVILNSILKYLNINSKLIEGNVFNNSDIVTWNQVELDGKWYNFDLALNLLNDENKKIKIQMTKKYLFTDEEFYKTHTPQNGKPQMCYTEFEFESLDKVKIGFKDRLKNMIKRRGEKNDTK